ncbi:MAG: SDR family oxidoreductase [Nitrospiraceae bacterium]
MKIVVIGGTGLIGSKLVNKLREHGHEALAAAPNTGVNSLTGEGLAEALKGASVVVDVSNSPSWEDAAVLNFFETSTRNLLSYEAAEGIGHHVALSVVGTDRLSESGYFRAKIAQEKLIEESAIPYTIVHATQFFEFLKGLADISFDGEKVRLPHVLFQPMAADDVASAVARVAVGQPVNGIVEIGGPEQFRVDDLVRRRLASLKDPREVIADANARYAGAKLGERTLVPGKDARLGEIRFETWLTQPAAQIPSAHAQPAGVAAVTTEKESHRKAG